MPNFTYACVMPHYNDSAMFRESFADIAAQTKPFDEIIIVDDCSTDNSVEILESIIAPYPQARLIRNEKNLGAEGALNVAIAACTSDFLLMCSSNDRYAPTVVATCDRMLQQHPQADIVAGDMHSYNEEKQKPGFDRVVPLPRIPAYYSPETLAELHRHHIIYFNGGSCMLRTLRVKEFGSLQVNLKWHADLILYHMIAFRSGVVYVPEFFCTYRLQPSKSHSMGVYDWKRQREVIRQTVHYIYTYPDIAHYFKRAALLPTFFMKDMYLLRDPQFRHMLTPLMAWRIVVQTGFYWTKNIVPRPWLETIRRWLRM